MTAAWTCARCGVSARVAGGGKVGRPTGWSKEDGEILCLSCRRERAAEDALAGAPEESSTDARARLRRDALIDFEVGRDPERSDSEIARSIRVTIAAVEKARQRLAADS